MDINYKGVMKPVYLDYNATAPLREATRLLVADVLGETGNAASVHAHGRGARKRVEDARAFVAALANVRPAQVIFNSGATETNNTIMHGMEGKRVLVSAIEHLSVLESAPRAVEKIPVTPDGVVDMDAFRRMLSSGPAPSLVSVMLVNSETGVIQPVKEIAKLVKEAGALMHTDAVQAAGRIPLDLKDLGVDMMSLSSHKIGGPQGVGALVFRETQLLPKFMRGGSQETHQRAGTQNVAGIAGFGHAAAAALDELPQYGRTTQLRDNLEQRLRALAPALVIYGQNAVRVGNTSNIGLPGISSETQLMALDLEGISVSAGSACSAGSFKPSYVLAAMGADDAAAKSALRISLGWGTTSADIDRFIAAWTKMRERTNA